MWCIFQLVNGSRSLPAFADMALDHQTATPMKPFTVSTEVKTASICLGCQ